MKKTTAGLFDPRASEYLGSALGGFGIGLGARGIRHLLDLRKKRDLPPEIPAIPSATTPIPVDVSPEEAQQLESTGVRVKHAANFMDNVARGALFVPAAYAGWSMLDNHLAGKRKALAQQKLDVQRARLEGLMSSQPLPGDQPIHEAQKIAEEMYFGKTALFDWIGDAVSGAAGSTASGVANSIPSFVPYALGGSMSLLGLSAYNRTQNENKHHKSVAALKNYLERQPAAPAEAELEPVLRDHKVIAGPGHQAPLEKAAELDQAETNAPAVTKMKQPKLDTNRAGRLAKKLDAIPTAK